jgi:predicted ABC-type transport system involved in lysophospholipase L1 biosynthesis ATPase subunit
VGNIPLYATSVARDLVTNNKRKVQILKDMDGVVESGEMLVVLGPPGRRVQRSITLTVQWLHDDVEDDCGGDEWNLHGRQLGNELQR